MKANNGKGKNDGVSVSDSHQTPEHPLTHLFLLTALLREQNYHYFQLKIRKLSLPRWNYSVNSQKVTVVRCLDPISPPLSPHSTAKLIKRIISTLFSLMDPLHLLYNPPHHGNCPHPGPKSPGAESSGHSSVLPTVLSAALDPGDAWLWMLLSASQTLSWWPLCPTGCSIFLFRWCLLLPV